MLSTGSRKPVASKDNLEVIRGIGPTYVQRLNQAGIYSFNDLAGSTTEALKEITGTTRWDPAEWITEARKLSASSN